MSDNNPYTKASNSYGLTAAATDQRSLEGQVLLKSAKKLEDLSLRLASGEPVPLEDINATLTHNRKLWQLFASDMANPDHLLPQEIKNNIASLALFVFKRTNEVFIDPTAGKLQILIEINRNIASGLMKKLATPQTPPAQAHSSGQINI